MSKYSGECDFRDSLEIFYHDDFDAFMKGTGGIFRQYSSDGAMFEKVIKVECPADLIPYYPYPTAHSCGHKREDGVYEYNVTLSCRVTNWGQEALENELKELYEREKAKPVEEQSII